MNLRICHEREAWVNYILENNGHPLQLWGWGELKQSHGWKAVRLFADDKNGAIVGAVSVLIRKLPWPLKSMAYVPRGPVVNGANREELLKSLANYVKRNYGSVILTIEPDSVEYEVPSGWRLSNNQILPNGTILLDLKKSEDELLSDMAKKTRQYIRKSSSSGLEIKKIKTGDELEKCLAVYHETSKRAGFALHSDDYYRGVIEKLGDHSPVFAAYHDDQLVAFLWLAISADVAYELYGGMNEVGQQLRANYALKWQVIRKCKEWGLTRYDFGGLLDGGVTTFKLGWSTGETRLAGTFDYPLSVLYLVWNKGLPLLKKTVQKLKAVLKRS